MGPIFWDDVRKLTGSLVRVLILLVVLAIILPRMVQVVGDFFFPRDGHPVDSYTVFAERWRTVWQQFWATALQGLFQLYRG